MLNRYGLCLDSMMPYSLKQSELVLCAWLYYSYLTLVRVRVILGAPVALGSYVSPERAPLAAL